MTTLTFLGTGTSQGVPMIGCHCPVCESLDPHDKRLRSSVMIETGGRTLLIDCGPDFRCQMLRAGVDRLDAILFTHSHKDHIAGLDDVRAYNYFMARPMEVYAEPLVREAIRREYAYAFAEPRYPGVPEIDLHTIGGRPFEVQGVPVLPVRGYHANLPVLGFRIGGVAYLTDMNRIETEELEKLRGVEVLVINALRHELHPSHFSLGEAVAIIEKVRPVRAFLTHISHQLGRHADADPALAEKGIYYGYDGLRIEAER